MTNSVLVTGHTGALGSVIHRHLVAKSQRPVIGASRKTGHDLTSPEFADRFLAEQGPVQWIVHAAGAVGVAESWKEPERIWRANVASTQGMLELARRCGARVVHLSSYMYGTPQRLPIDEVHPLAFNSPYAASKRHAELLCESYAEFFDTSVVILRPFNLYGHAVHGGDLISTLVRQALGGTAVSVNDLQPRRDYLHVEDLADAVHRCLTRSVDGCQHFNLGTGSSHSVAEVIELLSGLVGRRLEVRVVGRPRRNEIPDCYADTSRMAEWCGWKPLIGLADGLARLVSDHRVGGEA